MWLFKFCKWDMASTATCTHLRLDPRSPSTWITGTLQAHILSYRLTRASFHLLLVRTYLLTTIERKVETPTFYTL